MNKNKQLRLTILAIGLLLLGAAVVFNTREAKALGYEHWQLCMCAPKPGKPPKDEKSSSGGGGGGGSSAPAPKPKKDKDKDKDDDREDNKPKKPKKKKPAPTPVPCTPTYGPPTLTGNGQDPPYPLTMGQDPDQVGVDLTYAARGGARTGSCNRGPGRSPITGFEIVSVELTSETIAWITGELADLYPGAKVKDTYPFVPTFETSGVGSSSASLRAHIDPLDPGDYTITVRAVQEDGQVVIEEFSLKVWLLEAAITGP
jgi:hypothetical protein